MTQFAINGTLVSEPKVLKLSPLLVFVKVKTATGTVLNCLVHQHGLNFLYQATLGARIALYGHPNRRKQFVVTKFTVLRVAA